MFLKEIYQPIKKELFTAGRVLRNSLKSSRYKSILDKSGYLLDGGGKKLRMVLVLLSAKATSPSLTNKQQLKKIAAGVELIHMASLLHDDVIDHSQLRHNKPTINSKWGEDVAIALGDYLYSVAFELISLCNNLDILQCITSATKAMCEGELLQVCERDDLDLLRDRYILIVRKKTASLFAASCQSGAMAVQSNFNIQNALKNYGLNFGIAFQIIDDCLDIIADEDKLGKEPGQDMVMGEITLPVLNLLKIAQKKERLYLLRLLKSDHQNSLRIIKERFANSDACQMTKLNIKFYLDEAKKSLGNLPDSNYKNSLLNLTDFIFKRAFPINNAE